MLDHCLPETVREELGQSREDIQRELGTTSPLFAYPAGQWNDLAVGLVEKAGFAAAFTTDRGTNRVGRTHPHRLRRINVGVDSASVLRAQLMRSRLHLDTLASASPRAALQFVRNRVFYKGLDAILTAPLHAASNGHPRPSRYERTRRAAAAASWNPHQASVPGEPRADPDETPAVSVSLARARGLRSWRHRIPD